MIKIDDHSPVDLDALARQYYDFLNPYKTTLTTVTKADGSRERVYLPKKKSLLGRIRTQREDSLNAGFQDRVDFWDFLLAKDAQILRMLVYGRPRMHVRLIHIIDAKFGAGFLSVNIDYNNAELTTFGDLVKEVFDYSVQYREKDLCVDNFKLFSFTYCPYCNTSPVEVVAYPVTGAAAERKQALHQLDHFYPKVRYPYLALSFFNLVPGCSPCNAQLKLEKDFAVSTHFNPFDKRFNEHFVFKLNTFLPPTAGDLEISVDDRIAGQTHARNSIEDFKILERYNENYKTQIFELLDYLHNHTPDIAISYMSQFPELYNTNLNAVRSIYRVMNIPTNPKEINSRPLGKLKRDICAALDMLPPP